MRIIIASDIHGSKYYCQKLLDRFLEENAERLVLLGDILYHGPRNFLPKDYSPADVIPMLNPYASKILCVKGNCDSDVDEMVLDFPVNIEYAVILVNDIMLYLTHGHKIPSNIAKMNCVLVSGHTHIPICDTSEGFLHINPGSVSIPKENSCNSYVLFDGKTFEWKNVCDGKPYMKYSF